MIARTILAVTLLFAPLPAFAQDARLEAILDEAGALEPLETVIIAVGGETLAERGYDGHGLDEPTNIKSASKTIVATMVGMAIDRGLLEGVDQTVASILADDLPADADPRLAQVTIGNLLSMQAGLRPTSGPNYGRWIASRNWVRAALDQPFETDPGGRMLYSTGSTHLLSAVLTKVAGQSSLALARDWFSEVDGFSNAGWQRDPQGIFLGGNEMAMSPRSLLAFGEIYRSGGLDSNGERLLPVNWIDEAWTQRTNSRFNNDGYGYGWFLRDIAGAEARYAWGYGGQFLFVVPELDLVTVMTSDEFSPSAITGHRDDLMRLMGEIIEAVREDEL